MKNRWSDKDAEAFVRRYEALGTMRDLALRVYSARLLGAEPALVLHGGGNTSVKTQCRDVMGDLVDVLCVKGSGWDLATIEPEGHPAVRLAPLRHLRALDHLSDEDMVNALRASLIDSRAPNPSVEALLHAYVKAKYIDHSHALPILALADQAASEALCRKIFGTRLIWLPYVMPGFALAQAVAKACEAHPEGEGLFLSKHGLFTFADTARDSYERTIEFTTMAEDYIAAQTRARHGAHLPAVTTVDRPNDAEPGKLIAQVAPYLRAAFARFSHDLPNPHWIFNVRDGASERAFASGLGATDVAQRGVATPDHVIRMKGRPLVLPRPDPRDLPGWARVMDERLADFTRKYHAYFVRNNRRAGGIKRELDQLPRVAVIPGVGLACAGHSAREASIAADLAQQWMRVMTDAEACGAYEPVGEHDEFDMEYWSLEQAKLGKRAARPLEGRVVVVTGGGGGIGAATARAFAAQGAEIAVLDLNEEAAQRVAQEIGGFALALHCDVTRESDVTDAFDRVASHFGGVDIVVSNAGIALPGDLLDLPEASLRQSFEVNFFAHQRVARRAVTIMRQQGMGGALLFNVSKQALNPGRGFGAYGTSKAALLALARQYAVEHGADGIRVNVVNADHIRSGLMTDAMIARRAAARGVSEAEYLAGNLLKREVTAEDVAQAFVLSAQLEKTTGNIMTVDGGNVAAMPR